MKDNTFKSLTTIHAQLNALIMQIENLIESEGGQIVDQCDHKNAMDQSTMGTMPKSRMYCPDCDLTFSGIEG